MIPSDGHKCDRGSQTLKWSQLCDGKFDCQDRSDEEGQFCKQCINNLYSCLPSDPIRCDLACNELNYVPCQMIQDRRACQNLRMNHHFYSPYQLLKDVNFYIAVAIATIVILLFLTGIVILIKYLIRTHRQRSFKSLAQLSQLPNAPPPPQSYHLTTDRDTLSSHIYEQCYEPPPYELARKYPMTRTHYEHVL